jgi:hypothetical protein
VGVFVLAASVWMIYTLEILKARHLQVLGFRRAAPTEAEEEETEPALTAGRR